ncbi:MAG: DUF433 domain-containing protein [Coleofasciculus sp. Co-bin14]|nr:DUF433 domain-containing protein [Coleofasciculus sp. Co-bin14]
MKRARFCKESVDAIASSISCCKTISLALAKLIETSPFYKNYKRNKLVPVKQLTDYFNFLTPGDIRLKGSRIGIETILYEYIDRGHSPEEIAQTYPSLTLEQVYATILYYLQNQETISEYMRNWIEHGHRMREEQRRNPPPVSEKLRQLRAKRKAMKQTNESQISD